MLILSFPIIGHIRLSKFSSKLFIIISYSKQCPTIRSTTDEIVNLLMKRLQAWPLKRYLVWALLTVMNVFLDTCNFQTRASISQAKLSRGTGLRDWNANLTYGDEMKISLYCLVCWKKLRAVYFFKYFIRINSQFISAFIDVHIS